MTARPTATRHQEATPPRRELRGVVERVTYQNPDNGYTVARLAPGEAAAARGEDRLVTIIGTPANLTLGEAIVARGWWQNNPKHGWQFQVLDYRTTLSSSATYCARSVGVLGPFSAHDPKI